MTYGQKIKGNPEYDAVEEAIGILDASDAKPPAPPDLERAQVLLLLDIADSLRSVARLTDALGRLVEPLSTPGGLLKFIMSSAPRKPPPPPGEPRDPALCQRCGWNLTLHAFVKDGLLPRPPGMCDGAGEG